MSSRNWKLRVQDILDAIHSIQEKTKSINFEYFESNETLIKAVLYDFIVIGEAAISIPPEIQSYFCEIPWRLMGDMRNVIALEPLMTKVTRFLLHRQVLELPQVLPSLHRRFLQPPSHQRRRGL
ncbi:hypothetical protein C7H19_00600 [Aphanothece hegewaldii CCALA 016]|uniref:DUF86 domain-containing protein n=1 Tax=Aphanothece hegewaldii CCALA 016 TaxID=2107694 RepID=A0A2T1M3A3_9CHRO|nr:HepT-like ribonuclease domain-containing protein [Aphanothece hegewaldii]PSF39321.1 hypothetical protein C7H19_00600 [Aphanothece hegewaldii CCALA 016]